MQARHILFAATNTVPAVDLSQPTALGRERLQRLHEVQPGDRTGLIPLDDSQSLPHQQHVYQGANGVPTEVEFAVSNYQPKAGFQLVGQGPTERSFIYKWGVRVRHESDLTVCGWICLASEHCRSLESVYVLYGGKTSRATKHLKDVHQVTSVKTTLEDSRKRTRDEIVTCTIAAAQTHESSERISLLLQTLLVVHNNLPFIMGEWEESQILRAVVSKDNFRAVVNRRSITHSVIELYASAKRELIRFINDNRLLNVKCFVMVADFWTAKNPGTRHFQPLYGERDDGIRGPFKRWIIQILSDFGLSVDDFFGATTDGGPDVQHMMKANLQLSWEWCMPHLTNAATKSAFGMTSNIARSKKPEMLQLLKKVTRTIYQVRSVEVMGDLYEQLVRLLGVGKEKKLIDYKPHRFMSLTRVFQRIVKHWNVVCLWYDERAIKAVRDKAAPASPFPLAEVRLLMEQLLSLIQPISDLNVKSQAEKPNQVDVLISAYKTMVTVLGPEVPLRRYDAMRENPTSYQHSILLPLVTKTRQLLCDAFHSRFFSRYTGRDVMKTCSYVWEMHMLLHPQLKKPDGPLMEMVKCCGKLRRLGDDVIERNKAVVKSMVKMETQHYQAGAFSDDVSELFDIRTMAPEPASPHLRQEELIDEELEQWFRDPALLQPNGERPESVLQFWKRHHDSGTYRFLPSVIRIVFAAPASSAQIERDFGISGQMVTVQRCSLSPENIDMCSFLNRNKDFIDVTQCSKLSPEETRQTVPSNVKLNLDPQTAMEMFESDWEHA